VSAPQPEPRFIGWRRLVLPSGRLGRWQAVVAGDTERETLDRLREFEEGEHKHRDLCVLPVGKKP
jgi:hypothetical protein